MNISRTKSCCVFKCTNTPWNSGVKFFCFPEESLRPVQRNKWVSTIQNNNGSLWVPNECSLICSEHFEKGQPSKDPQDPDYVPSVFASRRKVHDVKSQSVSLKRFALEYMKIEQLLERPHGVNLNKKKRRRAYVRLAAALAVPVSTVRVWERRFRQYFEEKISDPEHAWEPAADGAPNWKAAVEKRLYADPLIRLSAMGSGGGAVSARGVVAALCAAARARGTLCSTAMYQDVRRALRLSSAINDLHAVWVSAQRVALAQLRLAARGGDAAVPPSAAELADLVLLHTDVDMHRLLTQESVSLHEESAALHALWELVQQLRLEEAALEPGRERARRWSVAHRDYLASGRTASLVVLQRRWHELKLQARVNLAAHWRRPQPAPPGPEPPPHELYPRPVPLHISILERYPHVATAPFKSWRELVLDGSIVVEPLEEENDITVKPNEVSEVATASTTPSDPNTANLDEPKDAQNAESDTLCQEPDIKRPKIEQSLNVDDLADQSTADDHLSEHPTDNKVLIELSVGHTFKDERSADSEQTVNGSRLRELLVYGESKADPIHRRDNEMSSPERANGSDTDTEDHLVIDECSHMTPCSLKGEPTAHTDRHSGDTVSPYALLGNVPTIEVLHMIDPSTVKTEILFESDEDDFQPCGELDKDETELAIKGEASFISSRIVFADEEPGRSRDVTHAMDCHYLQNMDDETSTFDPKLLMDTSVPLFRIDKTRVWRNNVRKDNSIRVSRIHRRYYTPKPNKICKNNESTTQEITVDTSCLDKAAHTDTIRQLCRNLKREIIEEQPEVPEGKTSDNKAEVPEGNTPDNTPEEPEGNLPETKPVVPEGNTSDNKAEVPEGNTPDNTPEEPEGNLPETKPVVPEGNTSDNKAEVPEGNTPDNTPEEPEGNLPETKPVVPEGNTSDNNAEVPEGNTPDNTPEEPEGNLPETKPVVPEGNTSDNNAEAESDSDDDQLLIDIRKEKSEDTTSDAEDAAVGDLLEDSSSDDGRVNEEMLIALHGRGGRVGRWAAQGGFSSASGRVAKPVSLPDIEQVRRLNSAMRVAQVAPITSATSGLGQDVPMEQPPADAADNNYPLVAAADSALELPAPHELRAALRDLAMESTVQWATELRRRRARGSAEVYCCEARRQREVNDTQRRFGLPNVKQHTPAGGASCCCAHLSAAAARRRLDAQQRALHDDIERMLWKTSESRGSHSKPKRSRSPSPAQPSTSATTAIAATTTTTTTAVHKQVSTGTNKTSSNTKKTPSNTNKTPSNTNKTASNTNKKPSNTNKMPSNTNKTPSNTITTLSNTNRTPSNISMLKKAKGWKAKAKLSINCPTKQRRKATRPPSPPAPAPLENAYDEWQRQKTLNAQYFYISSNPSSKKDITARASVVQTSTTQNTAAINTTLQSTPVQSASLDTAVSSSNQQSVPQGAPQGLMPNISESLLVGPILPPAAVLVPAASQPPPAPLAPAPPAPVPLAPAPPQPVPFAPAPPAALGKVWYDNLVRIAPKPATEPVSASSPAATCRAVTSEPTKPLSILEEYSRALSAAPAPAGPSTSTTIVMAITVPSKRVSTGTNTLYVNDTIDLTEETDSALSVTVQPKQTTTSPVVDLVGVVKTHVNPVNNSVSLRRPKWYSNKSRGRSLLKTNVTSLSDKSPHDVGPMFLCKRIHDGDVIELDSSDSNHSAGADGIQLCNFDEGIIAINNTSKPAVYINKSSNKNQSSKTKSSSDQATSKADKSLNKAAATRNDESVTKASGSATAAADTCAAASSLPAKKPKKQPIHNTEDKATCSTNQQLQECSRIPELAALTAGSGRCPARRCDPAAMPAFMQQLRRSVQRGRDVFCYKLAACEQAVGSLPCGGTLLCVDGMRAPLVLPAGAGPARRGTQPGARAHLVLSDAELPCEAPTYWTLGTYARLTRVVPDETLQPHAPHAPAYGQPNGPRGSAVGPEEAAREICEKKHNFKILTAFCSADGVRQAARARATLFLLSVARARIVVLFVRRVHERGSVRHRANAAVDPDLLQELEAMLDDAEVDEELGGRADDTDQ